MPKIRHFKKKSLCNHNTWNSTAWPGKSLLIHRRKTRDSTTETCTTSAFLGNTQQLINRMQDFQRFLTGFGMLRFVFVKMENCRSVTTRKILCRRCRSMCRRAWNLWLLYPFWWIFKVLGGFWRSHVLIMCFFKLQGSHRPYQQFVTVLSLAPLFTFLVMCVVLCGAKLNCRNRAKKCVLVCILIRFFTYDQYVVILRSAWTTLLWLFFEMHCQARKIVVRV